MQSVLIVEQLCIETVFKIVNSLAINDPKQKQNGCRKINDTEIMSVESVQIYSANMKKRRYFVST